MAKKNSNTVDRRHSSRQKSAPSDDSNPLLTGAALRASVELSSVRQRLTVQLREDTIERLRNAVYWTDGLTIAGFIEKCIASGVDKMERDRRAPGLRLEPHHCRR